MNSVYLGDIDPNNHIVSPLHIRRNILFKLLVWDNIVLSDSQFLTDPRINILMSQFNSKNLAQKLSLEDARDDQRGFENLVNNGMIKIATRKKNDDVFTLEKLYDEMKKRTSHVPYLPEVRDYAEYLDSLDISKVTYDLDSIADMFRNNLLKGVGTAKFPNTTRTENELSDMFQIDHINFSGILDLLKKKLYGNEISQADYDRLYEYVYSCYSVNISAQTNCYLHTKFKNIPLHIDCGAGDFRENTPPEKFNKLRKTWALNPAILDEISFNDFIIIKGELNKIKNIDMIMKCFNGRLEDANDFDLFYNVWEVYVANLELIMKNFLVRKQVEIYQQIMKYSNVQLEQKTMLSEGWEVVESVLGLVPTLGDILDVVGLGKSAVEYVRHISHKTEWNNLIDYNHRIESLLSPNTKIITKFENAK